MISAQKKAAEQSSKLAKNQVITLFSSSHKTSDQIPGSQNSGESTASSDQCRTILTELVVVVAFVVFFVVLVEKDPGIDATSWAEVFYFAIM